MTFEQIVSVLALLFGSAFAFDIARSRARTEKRIPKLVACLIGGFVFGFVASFNNPEPGGWLGFFLVSSMAGFVWMWPISVWGSKKGRKDRNELPAKREAQS